MNVDKPEHTGLPGQVWRRIQQSNAANPWYEERNRDDEEGNRAKSIGGKINDHISELEKAVQDARDGFKDLGGTEYRVAREAIENLEAKKERVKEHLECPRPTQYPASRHRISDVEEPYENKSDTNAFKRERDNPALDIYVQMRDNIQTAQKYNMGSIRDQVRFREPDIGFKMMTEGESTGEVVGEAEACSQIFNALNERAKNVGVPSYDNADQARLIKEALSKDSYELLQDVARGAGIEIESRDLWITPTRDLGDVLLHTRPWEGSIARAEHSYARTEDRDEDKPHVGEDTADTRNDYFKDRILYDADSYDGGWLPGTNRVKRAFKQYEDNHIYNPSHLTSASVTMDNVLTEGARDTFKARYDVGLQRG